MNQQLNQEQHYLDRVMTRIAEEKANFQNDSARLKNQLVNTRKHFWDEFCFNTDSFDDFQDTVIGLRQEAQTLSINQSLHGHAAKRIASLERMEKTPYFGRFDFTEEGEEGTESVYIGISTLRTEDGDDFLVYDWRAPISSIYYDFEPGPAHYKIPGDVVEGTVENKWQYVIRNGKLEAMFDTALTIGDEILQQVLGKGTDQQMHSIVATIQQEQNQVVRHDRGNVLIVHGAAGSGKTSVAMQRIAYLLYQYRNSLTSDQILLFSPNAMFSSYVANVLPELGEENMHQVTFQQYLNKRIHPELSAETPFDQLEYVYSHKQDADYSARLAGIQWKASIDFLEALTAYVEGLHHQGMSFQDIRFRGNVLISAERLKEQFYSDTSSRRLANRIEQLSEWILAEVKKAMKGVWKEDWVQDKMDLLSNEQYHKIHQLLAKKKGFSRADSGEYDMTPHDLAKFIVAQQLRPLRKQIRAFAFVDTDQLYRHLFERPDTMAKWSDVAREPEWPDICRQTLEALDKGKLLYEDATPSVYLQELVLGFDSSRSIKHIVIDEAQDYSAFQFAFIKRLFPAAQLTILGDFNQALFAHANAKDSFEELSTVFGADETSIYYLARSYRSTKPIVEFTKRLIPNGQDIVAFDREGPEPELHEVEDDAQLHERLTAKVEELKDKGYASIAVICQSAKESEKAYHALEGIAGRKLITSTSSEYEQGVVVIPSYLSKGIEFEAVVVYNASETVYDRDELRRTFYTVCTRAMHDLHLFSVGTPTHLLTPDQ